jgi:hypothetical protein
MASASAPVPSDALAIQLVELSLGASPPPLLDQEDESPKSPLHVPSTRQPGNDHVDYQRVFALFLASNLWTLVMTAFPVLVDLPENLYKKHYGWYVGNDIVRLLEPIVRYVAALASTPLPAREGRLRRGVRGEQARSRGSSRLEGEGAATLVQVSSGLYTCDI